MSDKEIRILVVEDEPAMAMLLSRVLEKLGYSVLAVEKTGQGAIESAMENQPDLILMDIYLEGEMSGIQAAETILNNQNIPVIYATSDSDEETIRNARSTYPLGYILKPYNKNVLKSTIEVALSIREVEARKNKELQDAYETISHQTQELLESHQSAKDIQRAILPSEQGFMEIFPNAFILNMPKESLGGDFFWFKKLNTGKYLIAVVDCTGHGVPGSLMSVLVNYQMNKTLAQLKEGDELGSIFSTVDRVLSDTYEGNVQEGIHNLNAGFDAGLCLFDPETLKLTFCGAKRPLQVLSDGELIEYKGNRSSVGLYTLADKGFESVDIQLKKGDQFFMYSDGYADQLGGERGRRLMSKPFKRLLLELGSQKPSEQSKILQERFKDWQGEFEQMDDVLILGFSV